jgi:2-dehydro-3-deoxyphosphogluconate aldolase/(4S)-4-hydroxy-2-oxoglutarate aldolase
MTTTPAAPAIDQLTGAQRVIAVIRHHDTHAAESIARQAVDGGIHTIEVTFTTPDAAGLITRLRQPGILVGAGTILTTDHARRAIDAGAQFLVSPIIDIPRAAGHSTAVPTIPGVYTPSEAYHAAAQGHRLLKLYPASVGGVNHLTALREVLPDLRFMPTGGVTADNLPQWLTAGAYAVGVGSALTTLYEAKGPDKIVRYARRLTTLAAETAATTRR